MPWYVVSFYDGDALRLVFFFKNEESALRGRAAVQATATTGNDIIGGPVGKRAFN